MDGVGIDNLHMLHDTLYLTTETFEENDIGPNSPLNYHLTCVLHILDTNPEAQFYICVYA
jgi:hypothetical protein